MEQDKVKEAELKKELEALNETLKTNSQTMVDAYQYSLDRNYKQIVSQARLDVQLTEQEIEKKKQKDPNYVVPENKYIELVTINGIDANLNFQNNAQVMEYLRDQLIQINQALQVEIDDAAKKQLQSDLEQTAKELASVNKTMTDTYKYSLQRNYQYTVKKSELYLQLTREEIAGLDLESIDLK